MRPIVSISMCTIVLLLLAYSVFGSGSEIRKPHKEFLQPQPTEILGKKVDKTQMKNWRNEWFNSLNWAGPGVDWKQKDSEFRLKRATKNRRFKQEQLSVGAKESGEWITVADGALQGMWRERGSNNLAGRMHLVEPDFDTNRLFGASSGGNIWLADLNGEGWTNLNDFMQMSSILSLRMIATTDGYGCSQAWKSFRECEMAGGVFNSDTGICDGIESATCTTFLSASEAQGPCGEGFAMDCVGNCFEANLFDQWIADGYCDDGTYGVVFTCPQFNNDGGDCGSTNDICSNAWDNYTSCLEDGGSFNSITGNCELEGIEDFVCSVLEGPEIEIYRATCDEGFVMDCNGNCFPSEALSRLGDGSCDIGIDGPNFMCNQFENDRGDDCGERKRLLVGTTDKVYYTDNEGEAWFVSNGLQDQIIERLVIANDINQTSYVLTSKSGQRHLFYSVNGGADFEYLDSFDSDQGDIWTDRDGSGILYIVAGKEAFYIHPSVDGKVFLSELPIENPANTYLVGTETGGFSVLYAYIGGTIYKSSNGGSNWENVGNEPEGPFSRNSFACSRNNPDNVFFGGVNCHRSSDSGNFWYPVNTWGEYYGNEATKLHADINGITPIRKPDGTEVIYVSTDGGTYESYDQLETVQNLSLNDLGVGQYYSVYTAREYPYAMFIGSQDQGFQRCLVDDTGEGKLDFSQTISGDYGSISSGDKGKSLWTVYPGFIMYYNNILNSLSMDTWDFIGEGWRWMAPTISLPSSPNVAWLGGGDENNEQHIWEVTYTGSGLTSEKLPMVFPEVTGDISSIAFSPIDENYRYVLTGRGAFYRSDNAGETWLMVWDEDDYFAGNDIIVSSVELGKVYICGSGFSNDNVWVSNNHGDDFESISSGMPSTTVNEMAFSPDEQFIFAATNLGPYAFNVATSAWYHIGELDAPDQRYTAVDFVPETSTARFATYGRGVFDFALACFQAPSYVEASQAASNSANIEWQGVSGAEAYLVQYRPLGTEDWIEVNSTSETIVLESLESDTEYEIQVSAICSQSEINLFTTSSFSTYCEISTNNTIDGYIDEIQFGTQINSSGNNNGYAAFLESPLIFIAGLNYDLSLTPGYSEGIVPQLWSVWFDQNQNGTFEETELLWASSEASGAIQETEFVFPPLENPDFSSSTLLRVVLQPESTVDLSMPLEACVQSELGEIEDYIVEVRSYCISGSTSTTYEWIEQVQFGDYINNSGSNLGYAFFEEDEWIFTRGGEYNFQLSPGFIGESYAENWKIWIDFNQDAFIDPELEIVYNSNGSTAEAVSGSFSIPENASLGKVLLRVAMKYEGQPEPCEVFGEGETEDYLVTIVGDEPAVFVPELEEQIERLRVYPNPAETFIILEVDIEVAKEIRVNIFGIDGRWWAGKEYAGQVGNNKIVFDLAELPTGSYTAVIHSGKHRLTQAFIKAK